MEGSAFDRGQSNSPLLQVHEGMRVYDREDKEVGTVESVFMGATAESESDWGRGPAQASEGNLPEDDDNADRVAEALGWSTGTQSEEDRLLRARLMHEGFIRVDAGLLSTDRYVLPDQIEAVSGDGVHLRVHRDELIKR